MSIKAHWTRNAEIYWPEGIDTPGIVLIKVSALGIHYWDGKDEGQIEV